MSSWQLKKDDRAAVPGPVVVCVMDGVGLGQRDDGDAVYLARTPWLDYLSKQSAVTQLLAHGTSVGMPSDDDMGNSEVGHNALGAGRTFDQGAKLVDAAIATRSLFEGAVWRELVARCVKHGTTLHFIGLLSDGNVHSHIEHLFALLRAASKEGVRRVRVHPLLDGRDVGETSALQYVDALEAVLGELRGSERDYRVASGGGRMTTTMDRYNADWRIVERGWQAHVLGTARPFPSLRAAVAGLRADNPAVIDQDLPSFTIVDDAGKPVGPVVDGDAVVLFNFRGDRALELSRAFEDETFTEFERVRHPDVAFAGMMQYDGDTLTPKNFLVAPPRIDRTLGEYLARNGARQLAISETQKYGHVTYFWNGNKSGMFDAQLERYVEVPSDRVSFDERPWMKCAEITDALIHELRTGNYRHARLNFANGDMVGHTGKLESTVIAVESVDMCLGRLLPVIAELNGALIATADHGNADQMFELDKKTKKAQVDERGRPRAKTSHTLNPVPFYIYAPTRRELRIDGGVDKPRLANVAATTLQLMGYAAPDGFERGLIAV
jgi:2,3-bisphosphoglycerate-independent phosphoglycerate mutase